MAPKRAAATANKAAPASKATPPASKAKATKPAATKKAAAPKKTAAAAKKQKEEESEPESSDVEMEDAPEVKPKTATKKAAAPKKAAPKKAAPAKKANTATSRAKQTAMTTDSDKENTDAAAAADAAPKANIKRKRSAPEESEEGEESEEEKPAPKKARKVAEPKPRARRATPAPAEPKPRRLLAAINSPPTTVLDIYVFGAGENGELGLGADRVDGKKPTDVKRPRLNHNLVGKGVVQIGCGGMHVVALTKDNKILTWGVNDNCALGRDTKWEGGLRDVDADEDDSGDEESGLNPLESTPGEVDMTEVEENTTFVQVVGSDSASFALTSEGKVYGWGTFRASDGILGFSDKVHEQVRPTLMPGLKKIVQLATGTNHVLALDDKGKISAWGDGAQNQLARKVFEREIRNCLRPAGVGNMPIRGAKPVKIACGSYHSFVLDSEGRVFGWGLNQYGQAGHRIDPDDEESKMQLKPRLVEALSNYNIVDIAGGEHHSVACTDDGKLLTWGRVEGHLLGLDEDVFNEENTVYEKKSGEMLPHSLFNPVPLEDVPAVASVAVGVDNSFAVTREGQVYSWGFSVGYQTGQGQTDDVEEPTLIDNTAIRGKKVVYAGSGGPYSVLGVPKESAQEVAA